MIAPVVNNPVVSNLMNVNVDIRETDEAYEIHADVPGLDKKHIQVGSACLYRRIQHVCYADCQSAVVHCTAAT